MWGGVSGLGGLSFQRRPAFLVGSEERVQMTGCDEVRVMYGGGGGEGVVGGG